MSQITLTLSQSERVKEVLPSVYVFKVTAANAICKVAQKFVDDYYDKSLVEDLSENDFFRLSKMYRGSNQGPVEPYIDMEKRVCYTAGRLYNLPDGYDILSELVMDSARELQVILKEDLGIKYHFQRFQQHELLVYPDGCGFFDFHQDVRKGERTGTYLFYVNDNYTGGELEFLNIKDSEGNRASYKPKKGEVLLMPTSWWTEHRSLANTDGDKIYILAQACD